jgi:CrcB protein
MNVVNAMGFFALVCGSLIGATLRWLAQIVLNSVFPLLPPGTLLVNVVGGFVIGMAFATVDRNQSLSPYWRVFVFPGVLGGLTTFSSFTLESMRLLQEGHPGWAFAHAAAHVFGALVACFIGYALVQKLS